MAVIEQHHLACDRHQSDRENDLDMNALVDQVDLDRVHQLHADQHQQDIPQNIQQLVQLKLQQGSIGDDRHDLHTELEHGKEHYHSNLVLLALIAVVVLLTVFQLGVQIKIDQ